MGSPSELQRSQTCGSTKFCSTRDQSAGEVLFARQESVMSGSEREALHSIHDDSVGWRRWGPYVSDRAWATVREDYSADGDAWTYLPHDLARSKAYRWGEDGIAGI